LLHNRLLRLWLCRSSTAATALLPLNNLSFDFRSVLYISLLHVIGLNGCQTLLQCCFTYATERFQCHKRGSELITNKQAV